MTVVDTRLRVAQAPEAEIPVVVTERRMVATRVLQLRLAATGATPLPRWTPGAHIDVLLPGGLIRQYSLCGPADEGEWTAMVQREQRGRRGSAYMHDQLQIGQQLAIRGPPTTFLKNAARYRFIAGGIGITPILSMVRATESAGCFRRSAQFAYADPSEFPTGRRGSLGSHAFVEHRMPPPDYVAAGSQRSARRPRR
jgi:ferredoxin-NADP reductase